MRRRLGVLLEARRNRQEVVRLRAGTLEDTLVGVCKKALLVRACQELRVRLEEGTGTRLEEEETEIPMLSKSASELLLVDIAVVLRSVVVDPPWAQEQEGHRLQLSVPPPVRGAPPVCF